MGEIRVLLVDDHNLVRAGMQALLESAPDIKVVGGTGDGHSALTLIEQYRPDVVLLDISMPVLSGLEVLSRCSKLYPEVHILVVSMYQLEEYVWKALQGGAAGYLLKAADATEFHIAIRAVARGESYLSPAVSKQVTDYIRRVGPVRNAVDQLTKRQQEVLQLIVEGQTTQQIARTLNVSVKTVETHRSQLMARLDIHDVASLVRYSIQEGLVTIRP